MVPFAGSFVCLIPFLFTFFGCHEPINSERLVWREDFDKLDENVWEHLVTGWRGGNNEFQYYRNDRKNSFVQDGKLHIKPSFTADEFGEGFLNSGTLDLNKFGCNVNIDNGCVIKAGQDILQPLQSARLRTIKSFSVTPGQRVEVRAKMPQGDWIWPAIWLLPTEEVYGSWPLSGEIDMVEIRANSDIHTTDGKSFGIDSMGSTLHWGPRPDLNRWDRTHWEMTLKQGTFGSDFHLFGMTWTDQYMSFSVDNNEVGRVTAPEGGFWQLGGFDQNPGGTNIWRNGTRMAPFDQKFHFLLNVAVGGNFFPDDPAFTYKPNPKPWKSNSPRQMREFWEKKGEWFPTWDLGSDKSSMQVDYISVYQL